MNPETKLPAYISAFLLDSVLLGMVLVLIPATSIAEVVISAGLQELYDSNIYLEDDTEIAPFPGIDPDTGEEITIVPPESENGDPNDDLITNPSLSISGAVPISEHLDTAIEGKVGAFIFSDQTDEGRLTLDTLIKVAAKESMLNKPFYVDLASNISSHSEDVTVADGTAARQSQTHVASLNLGVSGVEIASKTDFDLGYSLARHDFLGEFLFQSRDNRPDEEGADYWEHIVSPVLTYHLTQTLDTHLRTEVGYLDVTTVTSNDPDPRSADELDRLRYSASLGLSAVLSEQVRGEIEAGVDATDFREDQSITRTIPGSDGGLTTITEETDDNETSFTFRANLAYTPTSGTTFGIDGEQSTAIDIDGDRLLVRAFSADFSQKFGERFEFIGEGAFTQFEEDNSLSNATDRLEITTALRYSLTEALALSLGWNYATQDAGEDAGDSFFRSEDYDSHRAFISLSGGLLGI